MAWESVQRTYEGYPLYLRRPAGLDFDALSPNFPVHLTITHELTFRRFDGAPEPAYNRGLEDFDVSVTRYFAETGGGQVVLVETFGGKRHYYFYVSPSVKVESVLSDLRGRFPGYKLEAEVRSDPGWTFIRRYTEEYLGEA
jgi:hypothetical protein